MMQSSAYCAIPSRASVDAMDGTVGDPELLQRQRDGEKRKHGRVLASNVVLLMTVAYDV